MPLFPTQPNLSASAIKTANYTITSTDYFIAFDASSGNLTGTLPDATTCKGKIYLIDKADSSTNTVTLSTVSGQTIGTGSATSTVIMNQGSVISVMSNGTKWDSLPSRIAGAVFTIYNQLTEKAGDTLVASTVGTTETAFASKVTLKAGSITNGTIIRIEFSGKYTSSAVLGVPTVIARVKLGSANAIVAPAVSNPGGATDLGFNGYVDILVINSTSTNNIKADGHLNFNMNTTSEVGLTVPATISSVNFAIDNDLGLSVQYGNNNAGNSLTIQKIKVLRSGAVNASN